MDVNLASVPITGLYAALLTVVLIALAFQIGPFRLKVGVSLGDGGNPELLDRIRRHANFIENVPLVLLLLAIIELGGAGAGLLHGLGLALLVCRIVHPFGIHHDSMRHPARLVGALGTNVVMAVAAVVAFLQFMD